VAIPEGTGIGGPFVPPRPPKRRPPIIAPGEGRLGGSGPTYNPPAVSSVGYTDPASSLAANVYQPSMVNRLAPLIDQFLAKYDSPLTGLGNVFTRKAKKQGIDPRLLVAIAGAESSFGKNVAPGTHNPFGWGPHIPFPSWNKAIGTVAKGLSDNYFGEGLNTIGEISSKYAPVGASNDPNNMNVNWTRNVQGFYNELKKMKPPGGRLFPVFGPGFKWSDLGGPAAHSADDPNDIWQNNRAVDLGTPTGTPVYSVARGRINPNAGFGAFPPGGGTIYGSRFQLDAPQLGNSFYYTHLGRLAPGLSPGDRVRRGDLLGYVGPMPGGPSHLHFAAQYGDPYDYLRGGRASYEGGSAGYNITGPASSRQAYSSAQAGQQVANSGGAIAASAVSDEGMVRRRRKRADQETDTVAQLVAALTAAAAGAEMQTKRRRA